MNFALASAATAARVNPSVRVQARRNAVVARGTTDTGNWNAYEGGQDKELTPAQKKAKNAKEDAESAARRAAGAKKMAEEAAAAARK